jgi:type II secretory ATPase GspE/PulE/Tfp pilus assembly ATPase PilB-like protein
MGVLCTFTVAPQASAIVAFDGWLKIEQGVTTVEEVMRVTQEF